MGLWTQPEGPGRQRWGAGERWRLLFALVVCLLPAAAYARVIAVIKSDNVAAYTAPVDSFSRSVNARVVTYDMGGDLEKGRQIAQQLAQVPPDLIFALGAKAAYTARKYVTTVPILYGMVINPEKYQLNQPNVTGITVEVPPETAFTQYRMFAPDITRLGVIYSDATGELVARADKAAQAIGMMLVKTRVTSPNEVAEAFDRMKDSIDSLWMVPDSIALTPDTFRLLLERTRARRIPYMAYSDNFVKAGALMSVSPDYEAIGSQAAAMARQILEDKLPPSSIPPAPPIGTHLTLNAETARALELKLDPLLLAFVDEVIGKPPEPGSARAEPQAQ